MNIEGVNKQKMAINATRQRLMKEKANHDIDVQCKKYETKCKYIGSRYLTKQEIDYILNLPVNLQDDYLKSIGKFEMEGC
jgi:hypothetical protein